MTVTNLKPQKSNLCSTMVHLHCPYSATKLAKFSMLHAKNIRRDFGVPIWFSATDKSNRPVPFVQLLYRWATTSKRHDSDPFLSFRADHILNCLLYKAIQSALKSSAKHFNLDEASVHTNVSPHNRASCTRTYYDHFAHGSLENCTVLHEISGTIDSRQ